MNTIIPLRVMYVVCVLCIVCDVCVLCVCSVCCVCRVRYVCVLCVLCFLFGLAFSVFCLACFLFLSFFSFILGFGWTDFGIFGNTGLALNMRDILGGMDNNNNNNKRYPWRLWTRYHREMLIMTREQYYDDYSMPFIFQFSQSLYLVYFPCLIESHFKTNVCLRITCHNGCWLPLYLISYFLQKSSMHVMKIMLCIQESPPTGLSDERDSF